MILFAATEKVVPWHKPFEGEALAVGMQSGAVAICKLPSPPCEQLEQSVSERGGVR